MIEGPDVAGAFHTLTGPQGAQVAHVAVELLIRLEADLTGRLELDLAGALDAVAGKFHAGTHVLQTTFGLF